MPRTIERIDLDTNTQIISKPLARNDDTFQIDGVKVLGAGQEGGISETMSSPITQLGTHMHSRKGGDGHATKGNPNSETMVRGAIIAIRLSGKWWSHPHDLSDFHKLTTPPAREVAPCSRTAASVSACQIPLIAVPFLVPF